MNNIVLRYIALPTTTRGLTVQDEEGDYNIYLNTRFTFEANKKTLQHEIQHITNNDFDKFQHVKDIERR